MESTMVSVTSWRIVLIIIMLSLTLPDLTCGQGDLNCGSSAFYCINRTHGETCVEGIPSTGVPSFECLDPTVCSMACELECSENTYPCTWTTTEPSTTINAVLFLCKTSGRFPDVTNCSKYFLCTPNSVGGFYQYNYTCPGASVFNAPTGRCVVGSATACTTSTSTSTSTPTSTMTSTMISTIIPTTVAPFQCIIQGRFPDPIDPRQYYLCIINSAGQFVYYVYTCPNSSVFNSATGKCEAM